MSKKECHMIPDEEKQCIWMTAGLISYKLCTRDYCCEDCVFDQVMRNEAAVAVGRNDMGVSLASDPVTGTLSQHIKGDLFYHQCHCWAKVEDQDEVRIGIDGILAGLVSKIKAVALPLPGEPMSQGQCFAHVIQERHIVPLISPLNGEISSVNKQLKQTPGLLHNDSWENGWLVTIKPGNLEHDLRTLMFGRKAIAWYQKREREVIETSSAMLTAGGLGPTMPDGGERVVSLADSLTSEQYYQILESLSRSDDPA